MIIFLDRERNLIGVPATAAGDDDVKEAVGLLRQRWQTDAQRRALGLGLSCDRLMRDYLTHCVGRAVGAE